MQHKIRKAEAELRFIPTPGSRRTDEYSLCADDDGYYWSRVPDAARGEIAYLRVHEDYVAEWNPGIAEPNPIRGAAWETVGYVDLPQETTMQNNEEITVRYLSDYEVSLPAATEVYVLRDRDAPSSHDGSVVNLDDCVEAGTLGNPASHAGGWDLTDPAPWTYHVVVAEGGRGPAGEVCCEPVTIV